MKDSVLFVNRDQTEIKEFLSAMQDYTFVIDTADSGLEAAVLLRKNKYKVVITGMNLSTYDGTKLIAYLNGHCPYTACIVYTTRVDLAQLRLLVNKRDVFRIFLKPVNYRGDFYHAIKDGFAYYDMQEAEAEERKIKEQKQKSMEDAEIGMNETISSGKIEWKQMKRFAYPLLQWSVQAFDLPLPEEERKALAAYEQKIMDYYLREDYKSCDSLEAIQERICQEFILEDREQKIAIEIKQKPVNPKPGFYEQLHFIMCLIVKQIADISSTYEVKIGLDFQIPFRPVLQIQGKVGKDNLEKYRQGELEQKCAVIVLSIIEAITEECKLEMKEDMVVYQVQMRTETRKKVNQKQQGKIYITFPCCFFCDC